MTEEQHDFQYTYSAKEQAELKKIREKYAPRPKTEDKLARLRRLDSGVLKKAQAAALSVGIAGTLLFGFGMSLAISDLGSMLALRGWVAVALGSAVGVVGAALAGLAYPLYGRVARREKEKITPEILRLTDELMK